MYLTFEEYLMLTDGEGASDLKEKEILANIRLAEIKVDELTFNRIRHTGFENLTEFQQEKIKQAVQLQADYITENGFDEVNVQSYDVLDISVTVAQNKTSEADRLNVSPAALILLKQTGLMCRRI